MEIFKIAEKGSGARCAELLHLYGKELIELEDDEDNTPLNVAVRLNHTDGGKEFDNDVMHQFQSITGLKQSFGIPLAPNTRGIAERNVATSIRFVSSICQDFGRHNAWGLFRPLVMRAINCLPRRALKSSPVNLHN